MSLEGIEMAVPPQSRHLHPAHLDGGLPVGRVPVWTPGERLPIGVQVIAPPWREDLALRVAHALEAAGVCVAPVADL